MTAMMGGMAVLLGQTGGSRRAAESGSEIAQWAGDNGMQLLVIIGGLVLLVLVLVVAIKMRRD